MTAGAGAGRLPTAHRHPAWTGKRLWAWLRTALLLVPAGLSLLVPRREGLVVAGAAGPHVDNIVGLLAAGRPPAWVDLVVVASPRHAQDPRLARAVEQAGGRVVRRSSPRALWAVARAAWILLPAHRRDAWQMALAGARLAYINHGPWMKAMPARPDPRRRSVRLFRRLFGRYRVVLASSEDELADYTEWKGGAGCQVVCLGYPRSAILDEAGRAGLRNDKVWLMPTWKDAADPSYSEGLARRLHAALVQAGVAGACVELKPHPLSPLRPVTAGTPDDRRPGLVVTDFSSVAFDQEYLGGEVLLYSRIKQAYLAERGLRPSMHDWLEANLLEDEDALVAAAVDVVVRGRRGVPPALGLRPFDAGRFWDLLART